MSPTSDVRSAMLTIYFLYESIFEIISSFFAVLILAAEFTRGFIVHLFGFLTGYYGRGMFLTL
jgi:prolipoprotein diacylglyceryltransferase